jgi:predicted RNase H-like nuclease (RuvC/YqgF family)
MPSIEEIRTALGKMGESSAKLPGTPPNINENVNSYSEQLFAPVEQLESEIRDKDKIIESLKNELTVLKNQVSIVERNESTILKELEKSRWLESKVALTTKKVYEGDNLG